MGTPDTRQATPLSDNVSMGDDAGIAKSEQHRLLMARDKMNLAAVRIRAQDLQKTISQAIFDLETAPERYDWPNVLERFAVMNSQLHSITSQMVPLTEHYIVHPRAVDQQMAPVLPIMLASKLLPEQEEQHTHQLQALQQQLGDAGTRQQAAYVQRMSDSLNKFVDFLVTPQAGIVQSGMLDPNKGQLRRDIARTTCVPCKKPAAGGQRAGATYGARELAGPDLFLAVATKGHGLHKP